MIAETGKVATETSHLGANNFSGNLIIAILIDYNLQRGNKDAMASILVDRKLC